MRCVGGKEREGEMDERGRLTTGRGGKVLALCSGMACHAGLWQDAARPRQVR